MSRTRKPCPGCGEVEPKRPADSVCFRCERQLATYTTMEKERDLLVAQYRLVPSEFRKSYEARGAYADISDAILEMIDNMPRKNGATLIPEGLDLHRLYQKTLQVAENEYKRGMDNGKRILLRLNSGDMSLSDFDRSR